MNDRTTGRLSDRTRKLTTLAMLATIAFVLMFISKMLPIPMLSFGGLTLTYDPKDIVIVIAGFIYGPFSSFMISLVVSLLEMVTVSTTGPIGMVMNVLATCAFACTAAFIYKHWQNIKGAVVGLAAGVVLMTGVMLLWNYYLTPLYIGLPREVVSAMLLPLFLPFNLIKGALNAAITLLLYKPLVTGLRRAGLLKPARDVAPGDKPGAGPEQRQGFRLSAGVVVLAVVLLATCVLLILSLQGII